MKIGLDKIMLALILFITLLLLVGMADKSKDKSAKNALTKNELVQLVKGTDTPNTKKNCLSVSIAYDMRVRYYDEEYARPTSNDSKGISRDKVCKLFENDCYFIEVNAYKIDSYIEKNYPVGSFGFISGRYEENDVIKGHIFNWYNTEDGVVFIDATDEKITSVVTKGYIESAYFEVSILRTDNLTYSNKIADYVNLMGE